jgi:hypothetical protein
VVLITVYGNDGAQGLAVVLAVLYDMQNAILIQGPLLLDVLIVGANIHSSLDKGSVVRKEAPLKNGILNNGELYGICGLVLSGGAI